MEQSHFRTKIKFKAHRKVFMLENFSPPNHTCTQHLHTTQLEKNRSKRVCVYYMVDNVDNDSKTHAKKRQEHDMGRVGEKCLPQNQQARLLYRSTPSLSVAHPTHPTRSISAAKRAEHSESDGSDRWGRKISTLETPTVQEQNS